MSAFADLSFDFSGKAALVTGAGEGIGFCVAEQLAKAGAAVMLNDLDPERAQLAAERITAAGGRCAGVGGDVADADTCRVLVDRAVEVFGELQFLVANAGLTLQADFFELPPDDFDRVLNVNLRGSFFLAQAAARHMRVSGGGRLVLLSSINARRAGKGLETYGTAKAAVEALARNLTPVLAPQGVTVNAVAPGGVVTPRNLRAQPDYAERWAAAAPVPEPIYPEDVAAGVLYLLSSAATKISGQTLLIDGGWSVSR